MKRYILIAGVNGAGKTTFYSTEEKFGDLIKINFDETVRSIGDWKNAADIKKAGLLVWKKIEECFERNLSFSQETTLCGQSINKTSGGKQIPLSESNGHLGMTVGIPDSFL